MTPNETFLLEAQDAAKAANHPFPSYAACEAALETAKNIKGQAPESNFGKTALYLKGNNVFGNKQPVKKVYKSIRLLTPEVINGNRVTVAAEFISFPDTQAAFDFRVTTLNKNKDRYQQALDAKTGEDFVCQVSAQWEPAKDANDTPDSETHPVFQFASGYQRFVGGRWSTAPNRASAVLAIYKQYASLFGGSGKSAPVPTPVPAKAEQSEEHGS